MKPIATFAFSLVELSIVLVILGLLAGGILAGKSLIRASELRAVVTEHDRYLTAINSFRDKYFYLPGDIPNASAIWGAADGSTGSTNACYTTDSTGLKTTCNGNGDGKINAGTAIELFRVWQHLTDAGLIEGSYNGINGATSGSAYDHDPGINCPSSKLSGAGWGVRYQGPYGGDSASFAEDYGHEMIFGGDATTMPVSGAITPTEAWNIDTKVDDGRPARGKVYARHISTCTDAVDYSSLDANYAVTGTALTCALSFARQF